MHGSDIPRSLQGLCKVQTLVLRLGLPGRLSGIMAPTAPPNTLGVVTLEKARKNTGPKGCNHKVPTYKLESSGPQGTFKPVGAWTCSCSLLGSCWPHLAWQLLIWLYYFIFLCLAYHSPADLTLPLHSHLHLGPYSKLPQDLLTHHFPKLSSSGTSECVSVS